MKRFFTDSKYKFITPFGSLLGSYQGVNSFSNGHDHFYSRQQNYYNGLYTGIKYQCVEYARRWLQQSKGLNFHNVPHAADLWKLRYFERIVDNKLVHLTTIENGNEFPPIEDSLLIWPRSSHNPYGHIAIITHVNLEQLFIRIAEQNLCNNYWSGNYSRELKLEKNNGKYWIQDKDEPLGWIKIEQLLSENNNLNKTFSRVTKIFSKEDFNFLNVNNPAEAYFGQRNGWGITSSSDKSISYYQFDSHFAERLRLATLELNHMCLIATDTVIKSDLLLDKFGFPEWSWEKIRKSWTDWQEKRQILSGRFDLAVNGREIKMIEFNADSAGILIETAVIQEKWAKASGSDVGVSAGENIEGLLISQSKKMFDGLIHIMIDSDPEEITGSLYMQDIFKKAGLESKIIMGTKFSNDSSGKFFDEDGREIKRVWKTWNWETLIADYESPRENNQIKLSDFFFNEDVFILEPFWKVVTSNKALLAVLWEIFPNHPYLLCTEWNLDGYFKNKPYVKKPIVGRCGENIEIIDVTGSKIEAKGGNFGNRQSVYQEVFDIEKHNGFYPIIGSWMIGIQAGGFGIREDSKRITEYDSPYASCRVVSEKNEK